MANTGAQRCQPNYGLPEAEWESEGDVSRDLSCFRSDEVKAPCVLIDMREVKALLAG